MDAEKLNELKELAQKATPGPWKVEKYGNVYGPNNLDVAGEMSNAHNQTRQN